MTAHEEAQLRFFADYIRKEVGIVYASENYYQLDKRLLEVAASLGLPDKDALYHKARQGIDDIFRRLLLDSATNNETSFFRDLKTFDAIRSQIIPAFRSDQGGAGAIRIWCAACSFGQEPYSMAMMLSDLAAADPGFPRFEILATDISEQALERARQGRYSQLELTRGLPETLLSRCFERAGEGHWELKAGLKARVELRKQNLLEPFASLGDFDLVLCRNVLIYQHEDKKKEIVELISQRIRGGGYLMLGAAEGLLGISDRFEQRFKEGAVYFQKRG